ncbi:MAG: NADH-quinone oxidoreductase subunit NuoG [Thermodesulfobacteriota bacterium]
MPMEIKEAVTIYIEGRPYRVDTGRNLLQTCLSLGFDIPHFCWHPALGSVGACRLCAVKRFRDEKDDRGELVMSCMTPVSEGLRISIADPEAVRFRAAVIEWLMINHPHDCPVCDEGGECHLQDMTVMTGHVRREYRFRKRTHHNQDLGPFIHHEMNRCIQCYRCVRFYRQIAGGRDLNVFGAHDHVYFGRHRDGALESEFSGNLVEICPTGTFTDKTQKAHNTRSWDLQTAPSICVHCGLGCNTLPGERYGLLRRVRNRYHHEINGYFLCDRGRFGYEFVNSGRRLRSPLVRINRKSPRTVVSLEEWLQRAAERLATPERVLGIGSPRASLEANFTLRSLVGPERFHAGLSAADFRLLNLGRSILTRSTAPPASVQDAARADAVLVLGEDLTQTAPILALALRRMEYRQAAEAAREMQLPEWDEAAVREFSQQQKPALYIVTPQPTRLDDAACATFRLPPDLIADLGFAVGRALAQPLTEARKPKEISVEPAAEIARALINARRPLVVTGASLGSEAAVQAAANIAWTLGRLGKPAAFLFCPPECNSLGLSLLEGRELSAAFQSLENGQADTVIILENDLYRRAPAPVVDAFLKRARTVIVLDHLDTPTAEKADLVFPVATVAESSGILVNHEGRAQRFHAVLPPDETVRESSRLLAGLAAKVTAESSGRKFRREEILAELAEAFPVFSGLAGPVPPLPWPAPGGKVPRQSIGYSGRTAMNAHIDPHEPKPPEDPDSPLAFSMEGYEGRPRPDLITRYWAPGWNSVQSLNKYQAVVGGPLKGGSSGLRLFPTTSTEEAELFPPPPVPPEPELREDERILIPLYHLFGSEELSMSSPAVAGQAPAPYLALGPDDPLAEPGMNVGLVFGGALLTLPVAVLPGLCRGVAGLPAGLPGIPVDSLPARVRLSKETHR